MEAGTKYVIYAVIIKLQWDFVLSGLHLSIVETTSETILKDIDKRACLTTEAVRELSCADRSGTSGH